MATDSEYSKLSLKRFRTHSGRRRSTPRSFRSDSKDKRSSPSTVRDMDKRCRSIRSRCGGRYVGTAGRRTREGHRHLRETSAEASVRRIPKYSRHSESNCSGDSPKYRELFKKEKSERRRDDSPSSARHLCGTYYSKTYENRREQSRGRVASCSRERSRSRDRIRYEEGESRSNFLRMPVTVPENYKCQNAESRLVFRPHLPLPVHRPRRILLPAGLVPRAPHMRLPFPTHMVRGGVAPVLLAPVVIYRAPMMPLRPPIQPAALRY